MTPRHPAPPASGCPWPPSAIQTNASAPRLALRKQEAAAALGLSDESFDRYVRPHVRVVRAGTLRLYPVAELERHLAASAELPLPEVQR